MFSYGLHLEALYVGVAFVVGIVEHCRPYLIPIPFLYTQDVILEMVVCIEVSDVELTVVQHHQYAVAVPELTEQASVLLVVDAVHIRVEPHSASAECTVSVALQAYAVNALLAQQVTP